ncbi:MAG: 4-hydroxybenzoate octaprenyltransferase, partial [Parvibaculum sp.]|uniref:4-hydroxybenzoate octaprenyltransferase n=1 Tax=Parvibaculum sp. TaxID=2024848 RepID=UPI001B09ED17
WDRDFDSQVARTVERPIANGDLTVRQALVFLTLQLGAGLLILLQLNQTSWMLGVLVLVLVVTYPLFKRITYWPQFVLGLAFNWGALMGWAAVEGSLSAAPVLLYLGAIAWTVGYDTIYAHQDREDDALIGVKSTALKFGASTKKWLWFFYGVMAVALVAAGAAAGLGFFFYPVAALALALLVWQIVTLDIDDPARCLRLFRSNRDFGLIVFVAIVAGQVA